MSQVRILPGLPTSRCKPAAASPSAQHHQPFPAGQVPMTRMNRDAFAFLSGVFLLCMSVLMIQIVQTRILSVVSLYYMAFFSISMAMLGLTGGALIVYYRL